MQIDMGMIRVAAKTIEKTELDKILAEHLKWLENSKTGKRADLRDLDLSEMELSGVNLSQANLEGVNLMKAKLVGANLSNAYMSGAILMEADLRDATIEGADLMGAQLTHANCDGCKCDKARFLSTCVWDTSFKKASLRNLRGLYSEICDCDFTDADLEGADLLRADMDNAVFVRANLKNANFSYASRVFWSDFYDADMTGFKGSGIELDPSRLKGVKGLNLPMYCPEEGAFTAWKKCRDGKVVKLYIPEHAKRDGNSLYNCRASEAVVLDVFDKDGNPDSKAVSIIDEDFHYVKGETVVPKKAFNDPYDDTGIYFVLSRNQIEWYSEKKEDDNDE